MRKVLFATSEVHPWVKTGGLADVSASLPAALRELGADVRIVLPCYRSVLRSGAHFIHRATLHVQGLPKPARLLELAPGGPAGASLYCVDVPALFDRPGGPYHGEDGRDFDDNAWRFLVFARAVVALAQGALASWRPDIVHCNDWQTGLVPVLLDALPERPGSVFTVHNLAYQGLFDRATFEVLGLPWELWHPDRLEFHGLLSFIKGGLVYADRLTTVSPTYAREIGTSEHGRGLDGLLRRRAQDLVGILNGADYRLWDPAYDPELEVGYDATSLERKSVYRQALQQAFGVETTADRLLLCSVTRLTEQKGIDLVLDGLDQWGALPVQWLVLGDGEAQLRARLTAAAAARPHQVGVRFGYDETLAHHMVAGADAVLMPSRFEPCGLNQLYGLRYGTPPIVRHTGGLADTVVNATFENLHAQRATGFCFHDATPQAVAGTIAFAVKVWRQKILWRQLQHTGMAQDFGWARSARSYLHLYESIRPA